MHVKPVRHQNQGCLHFISFTCYRRMKLLNSVVAIDTFERELERKEARTVGGGVDITDGPPSRTKRGKCGATANGEIAKGWASQDLC